MGKSTNFTGQQYIGNYTYKRVLKSHLVDYAGAHPHAFVGKRLSFDGGVCVQRSVRQQVRFDRSKVPPDWLREMEAAGNGAVVEIRLDPRKLAGDEATARLLQMVQCEVECKEVLSVVLCPGA